MPMKDYSNIISKITTTPWMMMPGALKMMLEIVDAHINGTITREEIQSRLGDVQAREGSAQRTGVVGVMPLYGPIFPKANLMTELSGATSLEQWRQDFRQLVDDDAITSIVLDIDSPGGMSSLIEETADDIREAREIKPIYAVSNTMAASAAYGLAAQATKLFASPSSLTGNVGTYLVHTDDSALAEKLGVKETVIKAGRFKAVELESLTPESKAYLQDLVGDINDRFIDSVAAGRNLSSEAVAATEAKVYSAQQAVDAGFADQVGTLEDALIEAAGGGTQATSIAVARSVSGVPERRQSYDADKEHSEPGTGLGGEPTPREPPEEGDPAIERGWRRDPPPIAYEEPEESMNREWLEQRATALNVEFTDETTDEQLADLVSQAVDSIVVPLNAAVADAVNQRSFETDYPEQAAAFARLQEQSRASEAATFANEYAQFEGQTRGYSTVVRDLIAQSHAKIAARQFTHDDLKNLLDATSSDKATVPLGQTGSSRTEPDAAGVGVTGNFTTDRKQFADLVRAAMSEDSLSQDAAIKHVSEQHPDLARAYLGGHAR
jgi:signal peptide peptidase SppA